MKGVSASSAAWESAATTPVPLVTLSQLPWPTREEEGRRVSHERLRRTVVYGDLAIDLPSPVLGT